MPALREISSVEALPAFRLRLRFDDGYEGVVDFSGRVGTPGIFEPLADPSYFSLVRVHPELGTIYWPNGADVCPDVLYREAGAA